MKHSISTHGYYLITIRTHSPDAPLLAHNSERALIISRLQDVLHPRLFVREIPPRMQVAICIDLLAFSIRRQAIELVVFTIDEPLLASLGSYLIDELMQYRDTLHPLRPSLVANPQISVTKLRGPHHALAQSLTLHTLHQDWEYDRYSSIGFYLHDRRGSWMRTWRLTELYGNKPHNYLLLLHAHLERTTRHRAFVASLHG